MSNTVMVMVPIRMETLNQLDSYCKEEGWQQGISEYIGNMIDKKIEERALCEAMISEFEESLSQEALPQNVVLFHPRLQQQNRR